MSEKLQYPESYSRLLPVETESNGFVIERLENPSETMHQLDSVFVAPAESELAVSHALQEGTIDIVDMGEAAGEQPINRHVIPLDVTTKIFEYQLKNVVLPHGSPLTPGYTYELFGKVGDVKVIRDTFQKQIDANTRSAITETASKLLRDYDGIPGLDQVNGIREAFEISAGERSVRLYNFGENAIPERALQEITNAIREVCDQTGGAILDELESIAVLPETHSAFLPTENVPKGPSALALPNGTILINARLLTEAAMPDHEQTIKVQPVENTVSHELGHIMHFKDIQRTGKDETAQSMGWIDDTTHNDAPFPLSYANTNKYEYVAEAQSALHAGDRFAEMVKSEDKVAIEALRKRLHSGEQGPSFVRVKQIDLDVMPQKFGMQPKEPVAILLSERFYIAADPQI